MNVWVVLEDHHGTGINAVRGVYTTLESAKEASEHFAAKDPPIASELRRKLSYRWQYRAAGPTTGECWQWESGNALYTIEEHELGRWRGRRSTKRRTAATECHSSIRTRPVPPSEAEDEAL
jgi:hypothetical protein